MLEVNTVKPNEAVPARLVLFGVPDWSKEGRKRIARWLRRQADDLEEFGDQYAERFIGRYIATENGPMPALKKKAVKMTKTVKAPKPAKAKKGKKAA